MKPKKYIKQELYLVLVEKIDELKQKGFIQKEIANILEINNSTLSRILKKNILSINKIEEYLEKIKKL